MKKEKNTTNELINMTAFGNKIQKTRENMGYTQLELAETLNISTNFLGDIERGNKLPSLKNLIKLSNTLKVSLDSMFTESLDNVLQEPDENYYTDRQLAIMSDVIKVINENF